MMDEQQKVGYLIAFTVDKMTQYLMVDFHLDIVTALNFIYNSKVYELLLDRQNELYVQSSSYIYELLKSEYLTARVVAS